MTTCPCDVYCLSIIIATSVLVACWFVVVMILTAVAVQDRKRRVDRFRATQKLIERLTRTR